MAREKSDMRIGKQKGNGQLDCDREFYRGCEGRKEMS